jgi:regulator of nucleoside diphosphate kinase
MAVQATGGVDMLERPIVISSPTERMLRNMLAQRATVIYDHEHLQALRAELDEALVLEPSAMPAKVVTLHTPLRVRDLESGQRQDLALVSPANADVNAGRISVLAPLGAALLGNREGDEVEWRMPGGLRRLKIERVAEMAQPA